MSWQSDTVPAKQTMCAGQNQSAAAACALFVLLLSGCVNGQWARLRKSPQNPLNVQLQLDSRKGPQPTPRTLQMLRRYDLVQQLDADPEELLAAVQAVADSEPTADNTYAVAELAYIGARQLEDQGRESLSLDFYGTAVANAYLYLFDEAFDGGRNPYDPRFRRACDLYNSALESALRTIQRRGLLRTGGTHTVNTARQSFCMSVAVRGTWHEENFGELKFVSDFEVKELTNRYRTFGLGVPLIAVYQPRAEAVAADPYYPPGMSFPVTAFLRVNTQWKRSPVGSGLHHDCVIELHDPLVSSEISVNGRLAPLETDLTTPLAYSLDNPIFEKANGATRGLTNPERIANARGLYMLEPYDPDKIPVLMIHGFWSSLVTWMEMFNDLRGSPEIRDHYQFWFYLYPTGEPFWYTAARLRSELDQARIQLDPSSSASPLDQMVLVGHSMGGLIARLQVTSGGDKYWSLVSDRGLDELNVSAEREENLRRAFFFQPNSSVQRVVTIATPHRGSTFSNGATQWLGRKLIGLPKQFENSRSELYAANPDFFPKSSLLRINTSVDALAPDSPILPVMLASATAPWVKHHNIVGLLEDGVIGRVAGESDGVVTFASAHLDDVASEIVVNADHSSVHQSARAVLEVRRVLREHLAELENTANPSPPRLSDGVAPPQISKLP